MRLIGLAKAMLTRPRWEGIKSLGPGHLCHDRPSDPIADALQPTWILLAGKRCGA